MFNMNTTFFLVYFGEIMKCAEKETEWPHLRELLWYEDADST